MPSSRTIDSQLESSRIAITGAKEHSEIKKLLARMGYNYKKMDEGSVLVTSTQEFGAQQAESYGLQKASTARLQQERNLLKAMYQEHLALARVALKGDIIAGDILRLWGARQRDTAGWLAQVSEFYTHARRYSEILGQYAINPAEIAQGQAMIQAIKEARVLQARHRSDAQIATQRRRQTFNELRAWMQEFNAITRVALKDEPQYLEALGQVVKS